MSDELRRALDDLAARTTAEHTARATGLPVAEMTAQARRRRGRRAAAFSGVALTAVVAVVAASTAVAGWDRAEPMPAAPPSPTRHASTPTPTPTPTPAPVETPAPPVLPVGDPGLPFGVCGSLTSTPPALPVAGAHLSADLAVETPEIGTGGPVTVRTGWEDDRMPESHIAVVDWAGPRLLVVADSVVVGMTDAYGGTDATSDIIGGSSAPTTYSGAVDLRVCSPGDDGLADVLPTGTATVLPPGAYALVPVVRYQDVGTDLDDVRAVWDGSTTPDAVAAQRGATASVIIGEPQPFTVLGTAPTPPPSTDPADPAVLAARLDTARTAGSDGLVCGSPAPTPTDLGGAVTLTTSATVEPGAGIDVRGTLRWDGPGRVRTGVFVSAGVLLVRDGVIVGRNVFIGDSSFFVMDLGPGATTDIGGLSLLDSCDPTGATTISGEYQVHPYVTLDVRDVRGAAPAGGFLHSSVPVTIVQPGVTLTVQP
jgi:hypothetical protein